MSQLHRLSRYEWIDALGRRFVQLATGELACSDGRVFRRPDAREIIWVDGQGNGLILA